MSNQPEAESRRATLRLGAAVALAATLIPLSSTMLAVAIPAIATELEVDHRIVAPWVVTSYLIVAILGQWPGGRLADAIGTRRALGLGQAMCAAGAILGTVAGSLPALVAARVLMAAGGAVMVPAAMAMVRALTRVDQRVRAFGWFGSLMGLAAAIGPLVGGEITSLLGWRATFGLQLIPLGASLALGGGLWMIAPPPRPAPPPGQAHALRSLAGNCTFLGGGIAIALQNTAMYATLFLMPILLTGLRGESAASVGRALLAMTGSMIAGSMLGGHLADRAGARGVALFAAALAVGGLGLVFDVAGLRVAADAVPGLAILGLGVGLMNGPANGSAMSVVPASLSGVAAGMLSTLRYLGGVLGMAVLALLDADAGAGLGAESQFAQVIALLALAAAGSGVAALWLPGRGRQADVEPAG